VALIATQGNVHLVSFNIGDLMAVASMLMWAGYTVLLRVAARSARHRRASHHGVRIRARLHASLAGMEITADDMRLTARGRARGALLGIGSLLLAYAGWSYVVTRLGAARAGSTLHLMPAMGVRAFGAVSRRAAELVPLRRHRPHSHRDMVASTR